MAVCPDYLFIVNEFIEDINNNFFLRFFEAMQEKLYFCRSPLSFNVWINVNKEDKQIF